MIVRPIRLTVDLTEAHRRLVHATADVPVKPKTTVKLTTPLYICESHVPNGPVSKIAGLSFSANGSKLSWRRDPFAPYVYIIDIPEDVHVLHAEFDAIVLKRDATRYSASFNWEYVLLHPWQTPVQKVFVQACIIIPAAWKHGSALKLQKVATTEATKSIQFETVTVERLEDSPVLIGRYFTEQAITSDGQHIIHYAVSKQELAIVPKSIMAKLRNLVNEAYHVFGQRPYRSYHFLVQAIESKSGAAIQGGEEHCESTRLIFDQGYLTDPALLEQIGDTFCHEYTHAWNGKYRRPIGHVPDDFTTPLDGSLLWIYEGLTQYYGFVLAVRAGFISAETFRHFIADSVARMANDTDRLWRSTQDSAAGNSLGVGLGMSAAPYYWQSWQRDKSTHYFEGVLVWLEVDTRIRRSGVGRRSLDDFSRTFFSHKDGPWLRPVPYGLDDVVAVLNELVPSDWKKFFVTRVYDVSPLVNVRGISQSGYEFYYSKTPYHLQTTKAGKLDVLWYSLGVRLDYEGNIMDIRRSGPCDAAKLAPGQKILEVDGEPFDLDALLAQLTHLEKKENGHLMVAIQQDPDEDVWEARIMYGGGLRYPSLQRRTDSKDILSVIMTANCKDDCRDLYVSVRLG